MPLQKREKSALWCPHEAVSFIAFLAIF